MEKFNFNQFQSDLTNKRWKDLMEKGEYTLVVHEQMAVLSKAMKEMVIEVNTRMIELERKVERLESK